MSTDLSLMISQFKLSSRQWETLYLVSEAVFLELENQLFAHSASGSGHVASSKEDHSSTVAILTGRQRTPLPGDLRRQRETPRDPLVTPRDQLRSPPIS